MYDVTFMYTYIKDIHIMFHRKFDELILDFM